MEQSGEPDNFKPFGILLKDLFILNEKVIIYQYRDIILYRIFLLPLN
jgi:hypothetical protein